MLKREIHQAGIDGQLQWDIFSGTIIEGVTKEQLLAMLYKDAGIEEPEE